MKPTQPQILTNLELTIMLLNLQARFNIIEKRLAKHEGSTRIVETESAYERGMMGGEK